MKILQVGLSFNPGGIESFVMTYYRQLVKTGIQFDFISMFPKLAYEDEILSMGGKVYHTSDARKKPFCFYKEMLQILKNGKYDVVHVNMLSAANIVPLIAAKKAGIKKIIAHSHNSSTPGLVRNILHRINRPIIPCYANSFFACSNLAGEWLFQKKVLNKKQFHVIPNAMNLNTFQFCTKEREEIRKELDLEGKFVIGHVGRFEEQKNHSFLIEVFHEVSKERQNAVLLLVGEGELQSEIKKKVREYGLEKKVRFLGIRNDVNRLWKGMDVFVFPSLFEGLPIVALEAQASGIYSFLSDSITKEVEITDRVQFLSLKAGAEKWKERILDLEEYPRDESVNEKIRKEFRKAGYDIEYAAKQLLEYYNEVK